MKRFRIVRPLALCLTLITACGAANTGSTGAGDQSEGGGAAGEMPDLGGRQVVIGTDAAYPPFESVEEGTDAIVGFDPDLMAEIGKLINIQPEFKNAAFDTIFV